MRAFVTFSYDVRWDGDGILGYTVMFVLKVLDLKGKVEILEIV